VTESVAAARTCGKLIFSGGTAVASTAASIRVWNGLVDREQRPHLLGDALGGVAAQHGHARAHVGLWWAITVSASHRIG